jgi:PAS domain S-box-containing protein
MVEAMSGLFDPTGFVRRGEGWSDALVWLHVAGDLFIWLAFLFIPLLLYALDRRSELPFRFLFLLCGLFLLASGTAHLVEALMFRYPAYRLAGVLRLLTAVLAWVCVLRLIPLVARGLEDQEPAGRSVSGDFGDTALHRLAAPLGPDRWNDYIVAILSAVLALLVRAAIEPFAETSHVYVFSLLAVVYVSWRSGLGPGIVTLVVSMAGMILFFIGKRHSFLVEGFGNQLATAMFFFCGVCCAALGEAQCVARRRAREALSVALSRKADLEIEIARRRDIESSLRQREADLTDLNRRLLAAQQRTAEVLAQVEALVQNAPVGIAFLDHDLDFVRVNRVFAATGSDSRQIVLPGLKKELLEVCGSVLQSGKPDLDVRMLEEKAPESSPGVWRMSVFPVAGPEGQALGVGVIGQDVTEQERAADTLRESQERFRSLADSVPVLIWLSDLDTRRTYFNKTWVKFTGRPLEKELGNGWIDNIHPEDRDRYLKTYYDAFASRTPFEIEYQLRRVDGEYRWVLARGTPRFTPGGNFAGFVGLCLDVTDRKLADEAVRRSENNLADFFENANVGMHWVGPDGIIQRVNKAELDMLGYSREEYVGQPMVVFHENPRAAKEILARLREGERLQNHPARLRCKNGTFRDVLISSSVLWENGQFIHTRSFTQDVTEHKRAEEHLRESEARYRTLTEAIPQLVWNIAPSGDVTYFNRRWINFTGLSPEQLRGQGWMSAVHPDDAARVRQEWEQTIREERDGVTSEFRLYRAIDRTYRWVLSTAVLLRDMNGVVSEWVGSITDIDDHKRQAETLERMVQARTAALLEEVEERKRIEQQLRGVATELTRSNAELEQFAYVASHDLQEPLRKIQAFGDRLHTKFRDQLPEAGRDYVERMHVSAGRMRRLIDDLLTFSRVTTNARPFKRVDLGKIAHEVVSDLDEYITQKGGAVRLGELPAIDTDPTQIRQLFQNLIANAIKFHRPGVPPVVEVRAEELTLPLPSPDATARPACRILIKDNGIGFDEKYLDRIFQVFQRLHGRDEYEGTGVGLAICRKIVERHGGTITATSRVGEGTTFVITLPVHQYRGKSSEDEQPEQEAHHDPDGR